MHLPFNLKGGLRMSKKIINLLLLFILIILLVYCIWKYTPISANYYYNKGKQLYAVENYEEASQMFEHAFKVSPDNESYSYFYVASLVKQEPTYYVQEKIYQASRSNIPQNAKNLAKSHISLLRKEFLEGLEDNYIINAIETKDIIHWNLEDFPLRVYIQDSDDVPRYYTTKIKEALNEWQKRTGFITFKLVESPNSSNIDVVFKELPKNDCNENGCPYVIGLAEHTITGGDKLDKMTVTIYKTNPFGDDFFETEIYHTALHELGHALGIMGHSPVKSDVMYSNNKEIYDMFAAYRPSVLDISIRDLKTITLLYKIFPTVTNSKITNKEKYLYAPIVLGTDDSVLMAKLEELKNYIKKYPSISTGYINISSVYAQLGEYEQAIEELETAHKLANSDEEKFLVEYNSAMIYFNMQKFSQATNHAQNALNYKNDPNLTELLNEIDTITKELKSN